MKKSLIAALTCAASIATAAPALADYKPLDGDPKELVFGIISTESTENLKKQWLPLISDMEKNLGMKVEAFFASDYGGIIEGMRFGKVHTAWFGNKSAMEAVDRAGAEVFAQQAKTDGTLGYYSHLLVSADNKNINSLADVLKCDKSMSFGIGDPNSTSGFLVPTYYVFAQNKVEPKDCFKATRSANHETNLMAVANKQVDIATNNSEQIERTTKNAPDVVKKIKVVWTSPLIPSDPLVYRKDLSREMKSKIQGFFLGYGRYGTPQEVAQAKAVLNNLSDGQAPFLSSTNAQLLPIRQLEAYKNRIKIVNDDKLSADDKKKRLASIDSELETLAILMKNQHLY